MKKIFFIMLACFSASSYGNDKVFGTIESMPEGMVETPLNVVRQISITSGDFEPQKFQVASPVLYKDGTLFMRAEHLEDIEKLKALLAEYLDEIAAIQEKNKEIVSLYEKIRSDSTPYFNE